MSNEHRTEELTICRHWTGTGAYAYQETLEYNSECGVDGGNCDRSQPPCFYHYKTDEEISKAAND